MMTRSTTIPPEQATFSVADFLQLASIARRSVVLDIVSTSGDRGQIIVHEGQAYGAEDRGGTGQEAFYRLAMLENAEISCSPLVKTPASRNVEGKLEELLLEAVRLSDESERQSIRDSVTSARSSSSPGAETSNIPPPPAFVTAGATIRASSSPDWHAKETPMPFSQNQQDLSGALHCSPELRGIARANEDGAVLDSAGDIDSEVTCAVTAMVRRAIGEMGELLGLGDPADWYFSAQDHVWYVIEDGAHFVVADGNRSRAPATTMKKLSAALTAGK